MSDKPDEKTPGHEYPQSYGLGVHPLLDEVWAGLDQIKPGLIPHDVRALLAGYFVALLMKHQK